MPALAKHHPLLGGGQTRWGLPESRLRWLFYGTLFCLFVLYMYAHAAIESGEYPVSGAVRRLLQDGEGTPHKPLWPLSGSDIGLFVISAIALFLASGAGVGGGVLVVPALLLISNFQTVTAVALSNITIFASSIANVGINMLRKNPSGTGPLTNWDLVLLFSPSTMMAAFCGSYINMLLPSWVVNILLLIIIVPMTHRMIIKAKSMYQIESKSRAEDAARQAAGSVEQTPSPAASLGARNHSVASVGALSNAMSLAASLADYDGVELTRLGTRASSLPSPPRLLGPADSQSDGKGPTLPISNPQLVTRRSAANPMPDSPSVKNADSTMPHTAFAEQGVQQGGEQQQQSNAEATKAAKVLKEDLDTVPLRHLTILLVILAVLVASNVISHILLKCGTAAYWIVSLISVPVMMSATVYMRRHVLYKHHWKALLNPGSATDLPWTRKNTLVYPTICILAGLIAGILGLGGGIVQTPMLLELGVHPAVSVASTQVTLLITSCSSSVVYAVSPGIIPWGYGATLMVVGFISTLAGQVVINWVVKKLGRNSILVIVLALMFSISAAATVVVVALDIVNLVHHPEQVGVIKGTC